jgi:hypothetical protein
VLFCLVDFCLGSSPAVAAVVTYACSLVIAHARTVLGERNVAYKTLVDERFLS